FAHLQDEPDLWMLTDKERPVVARALCKRPDDRWPSCRGFVTELIRACGLNDSNLSLEQGTTQPGPGIAPGAETPITLYDSGLKDAQRKADDSRPRYGRWVAAAVFLVMLGLAGTGIRFKDQLVQWAGLLPPAIDKNPDSEPLKREPTPGEAIGKQSDGDAKKR